jgi:hypothetical protein
MVVRPCRFVVHVIDVKVPVPLIVVPGGKFEHASDFSVKFAGDVSTFLVVFANALPGASSALTAMAVVMSRFTANTPSRRSMGIIPERPFRDWSHGHAAPSRRISS